MNDSLKNEMAMLYSRPRTPEWYAEQRRLFMDATAHLTKMKLDLYSVYLPTIILDGDGNLVSAAYPDEMQEAVKKIDAEIQRIADNWTKA